MEFNEQPLQLKTIIEPIPYSRTEASIDFESKDWWRYAELARALGVGEERLKQLAEPYLITNRPWFNKKTSLIKSGEERKYQDITLYKDLALLIAAEIEKSRKVPEGWRTAGDLALQVGSDMHAIPVILNRIIASFPEPNKHSGDFIPNKQVTKYFSPEVCEAFIEHFRKYPPKSLDYQTDKELATRFRSVATQRAVPRILEILKTQSKVKTKLFTDRHGKIVEGFPKGTRKIIQEFILELNERKQ